MLKAIFMTKTELGWLFSYINKQKNKQTKIQQLKLYNIIFNSTYDK